MIRDRTGRVNGRLAGAEALDPTQPQKALQAVGEQFLTMAREEGVLGQFRSLYGAARAPREACLAFYRQGADRLIGDMAAYLRLADVAGSLNIRHPRQATALLLLTFLGDAESAS